MPCDLVEA